MPAQYLAKWSNVDSSIAFLGPREHVLSVLMAIRRRFLHCHQQGEKTYIDVQVVHLDYATKNVEPLAETGKLPHVAKAAKRRRSLDGPSLFVMATFPKRVHRKDMGGACALLKTGGYKAVHFVDR